MTQATVNVGNNAVKNLNPDAQDFSSYDLNQGTVPAGSTGPSDDSYSNYIDNGSGSYLSQHQSHVYRDFYYEVDPSSIDTLQQQQQHQQQQQTESNFAVHEHATLLDTIDPQQASLLNPHNLHLHQLHKTSPMPEEEQTHQLQPTSEISRQLLRKQLEYYFSKENMIHDRYLQSQMDAEDYVPIAIIANFKLVKRLTSDIQLIVDVLKELPSVEVDAEEKKVRSADEKTFRQARKRCIIILRDVPLDATEMEVSDLFLKEHCPVQAVACERVLESGNSDCWYVTFNSEDDAQNAFLYLTRENVSIRGQKVLARMKTRLWQKTSSIPNTNPATPVSPPTTTNNGVTTSPPPPQQQHIQSYQNSAFVSPQQVPPPPYSSHPQQQQQQQPQFNQPPISSSQPHAPVYIQTGPNTHSTQPSILGNMQPQTSNYRHPLHSSVGPPPHPSQHMAAQFSATNQTQHPTQLDPQVFQPPIRMNYSNYGANTPFDRVPWGTAHPQSVQTSQPTFSFATSAQQANMNSYTASLHQTPQYIAANYATFSPTNIWCVPPPYTTTDGYPTMAYSGANKPKSRRDYPPTSKLRNSTKPTGNRSSRHEGILVNNEHSNELLDYCQHSTPHSEGSNSPVPRAEAVMNRTNEPIVPPVSNTTIQHVQTYPTATVDICTNENVDQYQHQLTNDVILNNTNSHIQQQGSSDTNPSQEQTNDSQTLGNFSMQSSYLTSSSIENSNLNYQPLEQRKTISNNQDQQQYPPPNENQQQPSQHASKKGNSQQASIRPLMSRENRSLQNSNRPSSSQQGRSQQQARINSNSTVPLTVAIPKVPSATYYNQTSSSSSPQSPNATQKNQQLSNDNSGPRTYADMLKVKQAPQQQQTESTKSPTNELNDTLSPRAQSPINNNNNTTNNNNNNNNNPNNTKSESVSANVETNGPSSSSLSDLSPTNQIEPSISTQSSTVNESNSVRRNSSTSDHPQQQQQQHHHTSSPSHQQYNNSRGRGGRVGGNYRYSHERRSGSSNSLSRGGGRGGGRRTVNNNSGPNTPPAYQSRGSGGRGSGRFFDRSRGGGNYHNSNQAVHRFTGNTGNVES